ncbi:MAG: NUDIX hydrolase [Gemmatimonadota bacterium]|jgi:ADP-ribose pyrophosphatase
MSEDRAHAADDSTGAVESRSVFRGSVLDVRVDRVRYPDGSEGRLEIVRHRGAAAVLPLFRPGEWGGGPAAAVVLIRQYRYATGGYLWELPAGKLDGGEDPVACGTRELEEEVGLRADRLELLGWIWTTPGFSDEVIHLFVATGLHPGRRELEAHEFIESHEVPLAEAIEWVRTGKIRDAKTIAALMMTERFLGGLAGGPNHRASPGV